MAQLQIPQGGGRHVWSVGNEWLHARHAMASNDALTFCCGVPPSSLFLSNAAGEATESGGRALVQRSCALQPKGIRFSLTLAMSDNLASYAVKMTLLLPCTVMKHKEGNFQGCA
jgi:hypothetical protein